MKFLFVIILAQVINIHIHPSFTLEWKEQTPTQIGSYEVWYQNGPNVPATDKDWGTRISTNETYMEVKGFEKYGTCQRPDPRDRVWFMIVTMDKQGKELRRTKPTFYTL